MKPPPRKRSKVIREQDSPPTAQPRRWSQTEQRKLISALKNLVHTAQPSRNPGEPDYSALAAAVGSRPESEVKTYVESLMDELVSIASAKKNSSRGGTRNRKPIELWTRMASRVSGDLDAPISAAFSKMLVVCSTEPLSQLNSDPPKACRPLGRAVVGCSVPVKQIIRPLATGSKAGDNPLFSPMLLQSPPRATVPFKAVPASPPVIQVVHPINQPVSAATPPQGPVCLVLPSPQPHPSPPARPAPAQSAPPPPSNPSAPPTSRGNGNTRVSDDVDFERIYQYLGRIGRSDPGSRLSSMESAIVLDLLMSLPEELALLDCNPLKKHLVQMYQCLSSKAGSKRSQAFMNELRMKKSTPRTDPPPEEAESRPSEAQNVPQSLHKPGPSSSPRTSTDSEQVSAEAGPPEEWAGLFPPLNPFMIPAELLRRKEV